MNQFQFTSFVKKRACGKKGGTTTKNSTLESMTINLTYDRSNKDVPSIFNSKACVQNNFTKSTGTGILIGHSSVNTIYADVCCSLIHKTCGGKKLFVTFTATSHLSTSLGLKISFTEIFID